jgi:hypothetical protein
MIRPWVANTVIVIATLVWTANFILDATVDNYQPSDAVNGVFALLIGGVIALKQSGDRGDHER